MLTVASAGMLIGHSIAYVIALPIPGDRASVLDLSGHGYWSWATVAAMGLFTGAVIAHVRHHFQAGRSSAGSLSTRGLGRRLVTAQVGLFLLLELTERAVSAEDLASLSENHLLLVGVITQVVVAVALARLWSWLALAASRLGRWLAGDVQLSPAVAMLWSAVTARATTAVPTSPRTSRGPPCGLSSN